MKKRNLMLGLIVFLIVIAGTRGVLKLCTLTPTQNVGFSCPHSPLLCLQMEPTGIDGIQLLCRQFCISSNCVGCLGLLSSRNSCGLDRCDCFHWFGQFEVNR